MTPTPIEALRELVALKDLKDLHTDNNGDVCWGVNVQAGYNRRKPLAWAAARAAITAATQAAQPAQELVAQTRWPMEWDPAAAHISTERLNEWKTKFGWDSGRWERSPSGSAAYCSCCGARTTVYRPYYGYNICEVCWGAAAPPQAAQASQPLAPDAPAGALTFDEFRAANVARCIKWHPQGIESWSASDWMTAIVGELGEAASLIKMRNRERDGLPGNKFSPTQKQIADELADVLTYLDLLAAMQGIDLGRAAVQKFNETSERVGFPDRLQERTS